jgi:hypothetical protein
MDFEKPRVFDESIKIGGTESAAKLAGNNPRVKSDYKPEIYFIG